MSSLEELLGLSENDPVMRRAQLLVDNDAALLNHLIQVRKDRGLKQSDVARLLGISQASVAAFERYNNDPKLSTVRRYAQAVGALVCHQVEPDSGQLFDERAKSWKASFTTNAFNVTEANFGHVIFGQVAMAAEQKRTDFALSA